MVAAVVRLPLTLLEGRRGDRRGDRRVFLSVGLPPARALAAQVTALCPRELSESGPRGDSQVQVSFDIDLYVFLMVGLLVLPAYKEEGIPVFFWDTVDNYL